MSKSLGNDIPPQQIIKDSGAEVLRLWVAMVDFREEMRLGKEIMARTVEAYRKLRNTLRYMLANLHDFEPAADAVPVASLMEVDRYVLSIYGGAAARMRRAYEDYDFPAIFQAVNALATVDLSAFYFDVSKDRLYTFGATAAERRSAQTAMYLMADGLIRLIAPILPVTADELWRHLPGEREASVHLAEFAGEDALVDAALETRWQRLRRVRDAVNAAIEIERQQKTLGTSLEAHVTLAATGELEALVTAYAVHLPMFFIVSKVDVVPWEALGPGLGADLRVAVTRAAGTKCVRCWRWVDVVATDAVHEGLCERCVDAVGAVPAAPTTAGRDR
jgi:isoleucyl-tRNA synthetase